MATFSHRPHFIALGIGYRAVRANCLHFRNEPPSAQSVEAVISGDLQQPGFDPLGVYRLPLVPELDESLLSCVFCFACIPEQVAC